MVAQGQVDVHRQVAAYVTMLEDDTDRIAYDASAPIPALEDRNPAGYGLQGLQEFAQGVVEVGLPQYLARGIASQGAGGMQYLRYGVVYQVTVMLPDARTAPGPIALIGSARRCSVCQTMLSLTSVSASRLRHWSICVWDAAVTSRCARSPDGQYRSMTWGRPRMAWWRRRWTCQIC